MSEQFRPASADSPAGYGPGRTSRGELREGGQSQEAPYRIRKVDKANGAQGQAASGGCHPGSGHPNPGGHQPGGMQPRADYGPNYSQYEIDNWEMGEDGPWQGGYGHYGQGYGDGTVQRQGWPISQRMQQMHDQHGQRMHQMQQRYGWHDHRGKLVGPVPRGRTGCAGFVHPSHRLPALKSTLSTHMCGHCERGEQIRHRGYGP